MIPEELDFPLNTGEAHLGQPMQTGSKNDFIPFARRAALLEAALENLPEAIIVTDPKGCLVGHNRAAAAFFGERTIEIAPEDWPEEFGCFLDDAKTYFPGERMPLVRALRGETVDSEEMVLLRPDASKSIWIAMSACPFYDESKNVLGAIVLLRDITFRKQIEHSRESQSLRMEALYKFSREIAESGNNLNSVVRLLAVNSANSIGDASIVTLLIPKTHQLRIASFHHPDPVSQALLRKHLLPVDHE